jgi:hypothetical protein
MNMSFPMLVAVAQHYDPDLGLVVQSVAYLDGDTPVPDDVGLDALYQRLAEFDRLTSEIDLDSQALADGEAVERAIELAKRIGDADQDLPVTRIGHVDGIRR